MPSIDVHPEDVSKAKRLLDEKHMTILPVGVCTFSELHIREMGVQSLILIDLHAVFGRLNIG